MKDDCMDYNTKQNRNKFVNIVNNDIYL